MGRSAAKVNVAGLICLVLAECLCWLGVAKLQIGSSDIAAVGSQRHHHHAKPYIFPSGGRTIFPNYRMVALYGSLDYPALGALGEQPLAQSMQRVKDLAAQYQPLMNEHALPTFEVIASLASGSPTDDGDYSQPLDIAKIQPWIDEARKQGVYVVLDLQPGRSNFLSQAVQFESLLKQPNVGLALDPEWRLKPDQFPLRQIGSVQITELNETIGWLSRLTAANKLPQKLLLIHQFRLDSLPNRDQLDISHRNLAYVIQMDGEGSQSAKQDTWRAITANPPQNVRFGWKNFYHQDTPMLDPAGTMAITPQPAYVSYQ
jgi:hypothetical protein